MIVVPVPITLFIKTLADKDNSNLLFAFIIPQDEFFIALGSNPTPLSFMITIMFSLELLVEMTISPSSLLSVLAYFIEFSKTLEEKKAEHRNP